jgi:uroporphyrin-3 C-methyltransferase
MNESPRSTPPLEATSAQAGSPARAAGWLVTLIALAALALSAWQWHETRTQSDALRQDFAKRLAALDTLAKESRVIAEQSRETAVQMHVRIGVLENRLAESQSQQIALEAMYQELTRGRDEWTDAEIEQSLLIANQQLQLAGNVKAALIALQNVDMRLQRMDRPRLTPLRKMINHDIERLKALPHVDTVGIGVRLDNLIAAVDGLPLAMEMRPESRPAVGAEKPEGPAWRRYFSEIWHDVRDLVRIRRMDKPDLPLLTPAQSFFLRENLKLRLLAARLALLARNDASYRADLKAAREWLERYYDTGNSAVIQAVSALRSLQAAEISIEVPDISATLDALRNLRPPARERGAR